MLGCFLGINVSEARPLMMMYLGTYQPVQHKLFKAPNIHGFQRSSSHGLPVTANTDFPNRVQPRPITFNNSKYLLKINKSFEWLITNSLKASQLVGWSELTSDERSSSDALLDAVTDEKHVLTLSQRVNVHAGLSM